MTRMLKILLAAGLIFPGFSGAAGLGELKVISALGQPLKAEIDVVSLKEGEGESLSARIASPDAFKQAGVDFNPLLSNVKLAIAKHPDGRPYIALTSTQPVNMPFLDVLIDLSWSSGDIEREYTLLFDPVEYAKTPGISPPVALPTHKLIAPETKPVATKPAAPKPSETTKAVPAAAKSAAKTLKVEKGMTLSGIALSTKPKGVSLEQMLVALYQENSDAFLDKNMNRLIAGKVLHIPSGDEVASVDKHDAAKVVQVQAIDWNAYRKRLASYAVERKGELKRSVSGKVTASVEKPPVAPEPKEVLKLGKGGASTASAEADKAAKVKAMTDASERIQTLQKNISEMKKVLALKNKALSQEKKKPEPSFFELDNPVMLGAAGGLVVGLAGIGLLISRKRKKSVEAEPEAEMGVAAEPPMETRPALSQPIEAGHQEEAVRADPIEEAQLYFSYRRYEQAEEVLKEALKEEPGNFEAHLLLLKVLAAGGDAAKLEGAAKVLQALQPAQDVWAQAAEIGYAVDPGNPLYAGAAHAEEPPVDLSPKADNLDFDLDLSAEAEAVHEEAPQEQVADLSEVHAEEEAAEEPESEAVDFDLSSFEMPAEEEKAEEETAAPEMVDFDLSALETPAEEEKAEEETAAPEMVDFDLSALETPAEEEKGEEETAAPEMVDFDLSALETPAEEEKVEEAAAPAEEARADEAFDLSEIPSLVEAKAKPKQPEMGIPDVDLHLGEEPKAPEQKDQAWYEVATKLDLAKVYQEMGDIEGAQEILGEVMNEGDSEQKATAQAMLDSLEK